jgi:hypothetical protein
MNSQIFTEDFEAETLDASTCAQWTATDSDGDGRFLKLLLSLDLM